VSISAHDWFAMHFRVLYDVSRDWIGFAPVALTLLWLLALIVAVKVFRRLKSSEGSRAGVLFWLANWMIIGGIGFRNVWYKHFHCISQLKSGKVQVVSGTITEFVPELSSQKGESEKLLVAGVGFKSSRSKSRRRRPSLDGRCQQPITRRRTRARHLQ
jgi:hypothetical protein